MTEAELLAEVMAACGRRGLLVHHCPDSRRCTGTPGLPDLVILSMHGILLAELKGQDGDTSADQDLWLCNLHYAGVPYRVWRPADWESGAIIGCLERLAGIP